ncbi:MAG: hypothetical protein WC728_02590 [Elusimicrobiota bacterium]
MRERLQELVDGEGQALAETRAHVERCPACRRDYEALSAAASAVAGLDAIEPPSGFEEAVLRRVRLRLGLGRAARLVACALLSTWAAAGFLLTSRFLKGHAWGFAGFLMDPQASLPGLKLGVLQAFVLVRDLWDILSTLLQLRLGSPELVPLHWLVAACLAAASLRLIRSPDNGYRRSL